MEKISLPNIAKKIFWDIRFEDLDYDKDKFFIIEKVLNYGLWNDFLEIIKYYGKDTIKREIVNSAYLKKDVLNFVCFYFELKPTEFKCYTRRQSQEIHWNY